MTSCVMGQRNSSGMPSDTGAIFSSSIFRRILPRKPSDSDQSQHITQRKKKHTLGAHSTASYMYSTCKGVGCMFTMGNLKRQRALIILLMKSGHFQFQQPHPSVHRGMGGASRGAVVYLFTFFFFSFFCEYHYTGERNVKM